MNSDGEITGANWQGDEDNEILFGTMWDDLLQGGGNQDILYGYEGDDTIEGGYGKDRLFGDKGNDVIWTGTAGTVGDVSINNPTGTRSFADNPNNNTLGVDDFASGGSGNDRLIGSVQREVLFGGPGHDIIEGGRGDDKLYGGDGDDFI